LGQTSNYVSIPVFVEEKKAQSERVLTYCLTHKIKNDCQFVSLGAF